MVGPAALRQAVAHLKAAFGVSERRACSIIKADRKSVRYRSCRQPDTALRERLRALAVEPFGRGALHQHVGVAEQDGEQQQQGHQASDHGRAVSGFRGEAMGRRAHLTAFSPRPG